MKIWFSHLLTTLHLVLKGYKKIFILDLPLIHEVKHMYPKEIQIGEYALKLIKEKLNVELPNKKTAVITLHVVDYGLKSCISTGESNQEKIERCTQIIEEYNGLKLIEKVLIIQDLFLICIIC